MRLSTIKKISDVVKALNNDAGADTHATISVNVELPRGMKVTAVSFDASHCLILLVEGQFGGATSVNARMLTDWTGRKILHELEKELVADDPFDADGSLLEFYP